MLVKKNSWFTNHHKWDSLPHWIRVIPYIAVSGALTAVINHLATVELSEVLVMGGINLTIVVLKEGLTWVNQKN